MFTADFQTIFIKKQIFKLNFYKVALYYITFR